MLAPQDPAEAAGGRREAGRPIVGRARRQRRTGRLRQRPGATRGLHGGGPVQQGDRDVRAVTELPGGSRPAVGAAGGDRSPGARWRSARPRRRPARWSSQRGRAVVGADGEGGEAGGPVLAGDDDGRPPDTANSVAMARSTTRGSAPVLSTSAQPRPPERGVGVARTTPGQRSSHGSRRWPSRHRPGCRPPSTATGPSTSSLRRLVLHADERPDRHPTGEVVQVGVEDRADRRLGREGLAEGGEVEQQPPAPGAPAEQPGAPHGDALLLGVAPGDDVPVVGDGRAGQHLLPGDRPADGGAHAHGQVRIERGRPAPRHRQRVERRASRRARRRARWARRPSSSVARRTRLASAPACASTSRAPRLPTSRRRRVRGGQAPPDLIGQPAVQLVQAGSDPRRPLVGPPLLAAVAAAANRSSTEVGGRGHGGRDGASGPRFAPAQPRRGPPASSPPARAGPWWARCPRPTAAAARGCACTAPSGSGTSSARPGRPVHHHLVAARPRCPGRGPRRRHRRSPGWTTWPARPGRAACATAASGARASTSAVVHRAGAPAMAGGRWSSGRSTRSTASRVATGCDTGGAPAAGRPRGRSGRAAAATPRRPRTGSKPPPPQPPVA